MKKIKSSKELANLIDYTNLSNVATTKDIEHLCNQANHYGFYSVVVGPYYVELANELLNSNPVKVCTVAGFPLGFSNYKVKKKEVKIAIKNGADEIDMVANISAIKSNDYETVEKEINSVMKKFKKINEKESKNIILKVIIEAELLTDNEIIAICKIANDSKVDFIKTSTGLSGMIPKAYDINLIKKTVPNMKIKASGGIKDYKTAIRLVAAGADRLGTSSGDLIIEEYKRIYEKQLVD